MKLILMGTPSFVVPIFDKVADAHEIAAVFTRAPKPVGRKKTLTRSPVHEWAAGRGIPVHTSIKEFDSAPAADYIIVAAYGVILRDNVLNAAPCINIHPSDLPKYRGASPITTSIYNGDTESAVCIMQVAAQVDAGDVFMREKFEIGENDTISDVEKRVGEISTEMLSEYLRDPAKYPPVPQTGTPTFTRKWTSDDEWIDWSRTPREIHNQVRSIGGRTKINGIDVKILETKLIAPSFGGGSGRSPVGEAYIDQAAPRPASQGTPLQGKGGLEILRILPAGKKPMTWKDFVNGQRGAEIRFGM